MGLGKNNSAVGDIQIRVGGLKQILKGKWTWICWINCLMLFIIKSKIKLTDFWW